jgi:hypothetical protein
MGNFFLSHLRDRCADSEGLIIAFLLFNLGIAVPYLSIPRRLMRIRRRVGGKITEFGEVKLIAIFVASCSITHVFSVLVLFFPVLDWPAVAWGSWTALISWHTNHVLEQGEDYYVETILAARRAEATLTRLEEKET